MSSKRYAPGLGLINDALEPSKETQKAYDTLKLVLKYTARKGIGAEETNQAYFNMSMGLTLPFLNLLNGENNRETRTSGVLK